DLLVHRLGTIERQWALVLARLVFRRAVGRLARDDRARWRQAKRCFWIYRAWGVLKAGDRRVLARRDCGLLECRLVEVREAHTLHRIEVVEVAPVFEETVRRRERLRVIAKMVLTELAGVVAEVEQDLGERRGAGLQVRGAARKLRRDHSSAQRIHAGKEGVAAGSTALHGEVVHELRTFL